MTSRAGWVGAIAASLLLFSSVEAAAGPSAKDKAEAKSLVAEAKTDARQKKYAEAVKALARADELDPSPQTKLDLARALIPMNKLVDASKALNGAVDTAKGPLGKKVADAAKKLLTEVEPRVPWIQIVVEGPTADQTSTTIDGNEVDAKSEMPFDPGEHVVTADAEGFEHAEKHITLAEGEHEKVKLKLDRSAPTRVSAPEPKEEKGGGGGGSVLPAALAFGVGAAGIGVGAVFGIMAFNETSKVESSCDGTRCPPKVRDALDVAKTNGTVSTIGFVVGGVGVATGVVLLLTSGGSAKHAPDGADTAQAKSPLRVSEVRPVVGPGQLGVVGRF